MKGLSNFRNGTRFTGWIVVAASVLSVFHTQAHPGHALHESTVAHALGSPYHVAGMLMVGLALWLAAGFAKQEHGRLVLRSAGVLFLAGACIAAMMG